MQTRRARVQAANLSRLTDPKFLQAFGRTNPLEARQLAVALRNQEMYTEVMNVVPPRGDYRYGEDLSNLLFNDFDDITEDELLNTVLRTYITTNPVTGIKEETINPNFTSNNFAALRFCALKGFERCIKRLLDYGVDVHANNEEALMYASFQGNINIVKMLLKKGAILQANHLYHAARGGHYMTPKSANYDILRYYISLNESLLYEDYERIIHALARSHNSESEEGIATLRLIYGIAKRDNKLDELQNEIENTINFLAKKRQPTPFLFAFMTDVFNDGFSIHWERDSFLESAIESGSIEMIQYLLSKGATILERHITSAYREHLPDVRILFLLLSNIPAAQLANVPN